jgi:hypothetical protein
VADENVNIVRMVQTLVPELYQMVLGQAGDARTFAGSRAVEGYLLSRVSELAAELHQTTKKLAHSRHNLKEMKRQIAGETVRHANSISVNMTSLSSSG